VIVDKEELRQDEFSEREVSQDKGTFKEDKTPQR